MKELKSVAGGVVLVSVLILALQPGGAEARDPTIKDVMSKLHKGLSPLGQLKRDLQEDDPPWAEIQKTTHQFVVLGAALGKNDPPRGDKESWAKLARQYLENAKAMDESAQKKDRDGALAGQARLAGSCNACHKAHRPN
jgi:hypothetical protein